MSKKNVFSKVYYGWAIVGLAFCSLAFWFGIRTSFSVFYVTLSSEFPWQPGALAGAQSMALIAAMIAAPVLGYLIDRFGPRKVILPSIPILTLGLALCATVTSLREFYLYYGIVVGAAVTAIGVVTYSVVLRHWFIERRGFASGIAVSGMGVGVLAFVPLVQHSITAWGWRNAFLVLSAFGGLVLFPATVGLLRLKPGEATGPSADRRQDEVQVRPQTPTPKPSRPPRALEVSVADTLRHGYFWHFSFFAFFASVGVYIILVHSVKFLVDQGTDKMVAATVLALVGVISSIFRIFWGWVSDRIGRELAYTIGSFMACLGIGCLMLRSTFGMTAYAYLFAIFFGMGWGATAPSVMAASADIFDGRRYGFIFGVIQSVINLAGALGAWLGGAIFGHYQSYVMAFQISMAALALSCVFMWKAAPRNKWISVGKSVVSPAIASK